MQALRAETGLSRHRRRSAAKARPFRSSLCPRWDNGRDVVLAGDAAGVVAPASGEGIYYAMFGGRLAAEAAEQALATGDARALGLARKQFMKEHGRVFWVLGIMQYFWYCNDKRRERFVSICRDPDVQRLTWEAYMNKELPRRDPLAHVTDLLQGSCSSSEARPAMIEGLLGHWPEIAVALGVGSAVAVIGGLMTDVGPWYEQPEFPSAETAQLAFGPGWTVIFVFIAAAASSPGMRPAPSNGG